MVQVLSNPNPRLLHRREGTMNGESTGLRFIGIRLWVPYIPSFPFLSISILNTSERIAVVTTCIRIITVFDEAIEIAFFTIN